MVFSRNAIGQTVSYINNIVFSYVICVLVFGCCFRNERGQTFFSNIPLAITGITTAIFGISSFFIGIISIIKKKERAVFVFISTIIGFLVLFFVLGEFLFPH